MENYPHLHSGVADPCHFNVVSDEVFHLNANPYPDPTFHFNDGQDLIQILHFIQVLQICDFWSTMGIRTRIQLFILMRIRFQLPKIMRIQIRNPAAFS
jgi:hypothetical protein